jgi:hypothetical protein
MVELCPSLRLNRSEILGHTTALDAGASAAEHVSSNCRQGGNRQRLLGFQQ